MLLFGDCMKTRYAKSFALSVLLMLFWACAHHAPLSPVAASTLAAEIANDTCYKHFGKRPFAAEDYEAMPEGGQWYWGSRDGVPVDGYRVHVNFNRDGSDRRIRLRLGNEDEDSTSSGIQGKDGE